jgi:hypothetical protein
MRQNFRFLAVAALALAADAVQAQTAQRWSLQLSGISVGAQGEAYEGLSNGVGMEAQVRMTPSVWSFGAGLQYSAHTLDFGGQLGEETVTLTGLFIEPRRIFDVGSASFVPYASGRLSFLQQAVELDANGTTVEATASGAQLNAGGGLLFRMTPRVNLDLGATYGLINFGDVEVNVPGIGRTTVDGSSGSGSNLVSRVGVAIGLGK